MARSPPLLWLTERDRVVSEAHNSLGTQKLSPTGPRNGVSQGTGGSPFGVAGQKAAKSRPPRSPNYFITTRISLQTIVVGQKGSTLLCIDLTRRNRYPMAPRP